MSKDFFKIKFTKSLLILVTLFWTVISFLIYSFTVSTVTFGCAFGTSPDNPCHNSSFNLFDHMSLGGKFSLLTINLPTFISDNVMYVLMGKHFGEYSSDANLMIFSFFLQFIFAFVLIFMMKFILGVLKRAK